MKNKDVKNKEFKFFGEIIDEIQHYLHDEMGKQQITFSFNNHTRYLKYVINTESYETEIDGALDGVEMVAIMSATEDVKETQNKTAEQIVLNHRKTTDDTKQSEEESSIGSHDMDVMMSILDGEIGDNETQDLI